MKVRGRGKVVSGEWRLGGRGKVVSGSTEFYTFSSYQEQRSLAAIGFHGTLLQRSSIFL